VFDVSIKPGAGHQLSAALPAHEHTTVRITWRGAFGFACGTNMIHGALVVIPDDHGAAPDNRDHVAPPAMADGVSKSAAEIEVAQAEERRAEIGDLARRVMIGAILTAPVLFAVMAGSTTQLGGRRPARVTVTRRSAASGEGRVPAAVRACRQ
jgi:Cu+-exporting ATPase